LITLPVANNFKTTSGELFIIVFLSPPEVEESLFPVLAANSKKYIGTIKITIMNNYLYYLIINTGSK